MSVKTEGHETATTFDSCNAAQSAKRYVTPSVQGHRVSDDEPTEPQWWSMRRARQPACLHLVEFTTFQNQRVFCEFVLLIGSFGESSSIAEHTKW